MMIYVNHLFFKESEELPMIKKHFKKLVSLALTAVMVMGMATTASAEETASQNDMGNPSVYLSATDKLTFAKEMDELYAKQSLLRSSPNSNKRDC